MAEVPAGTTPEQLAEVTAALAGTEGVAFASPAIPNDPTAPTAVMWRVIPTTSPQDEATVQLVHRLRDDVLPEVTAENGLQVSVAGQVATQIDFSAFLAARLPLFFGVVLGLSFLLLMVVFRSLLVPLKAVIMNLLSIGAAYGVLVMVFQWGWLQGPLGIEGAPIEPFMPMMLFAIVFGLSMDYEVFLLSRIKEEYDRTGDSHTSVADGLAATARVITAAAAIMVFVFGSFLLESNRVIKLMGAGPERGGAARRHRGPHAAGPGDHGAARRQELVAAPLARPAPAPRRRRGSQHPRGRRSRRRAGARRRQVTPARGAWGCSGTPGP